MKKYVAALAVTLMLAGAATGRDKASAADAEKRQAAMQNTAIIPGQSIGPIRLGMGMDEVQSLLGKPFVASLGDIDRPVDMIDIFRNSSHIAPVVDEALKMTPLPKVIWMQLGARDDAAAATAEAAGLKVVMNRCPKIEYGRLSSEISWMGVNSRTLSSKRAPIPTQGMRLSLNRTSVGGGETAASDRAVKNRNDLA